jgi:hypothetical protein
MPSIAAAEKLQKLWKGNRSDIEKEADAVEETRKNYETLWKSASGRDMLQSRGVTSTDGKNFSGGQWDTDTKRWINLARRRTVQQTAAADAEPEKSHHRTGSRRG